MRNPGGYGIVSSPVPTKIDFGSGRVEYMSSGIFETDTYSCGHCNRVTTVRPRTDAADVGALCKKCMKVVCRQCVNLGRKYNLTCDPLEAKLERSEARDRLRRAVGV